MAIKTKNHKPALANAVETDMDEGIVSYSGVLHACGNEFPFSRSGKYIVYAEYGGNGSGGFVTNVKFGALELDYNPDNAFHFTKKVATAFAVAVMDRLKNAPTAIHVMKHCSVTEDCGVPF